jgi:deazaflavin-dependent oxidoreductase (nitroreductase family)
MWYNPLVTWILRSPLHGLLSSSTLLLTYTGRRSGQWRTLPISYGREGDTLLIITRRSKAWWKNVAGGAPVSVRIDGRDLRGAARVAEVDSGELLSAMLTVYRGMPRRLAERNLPESLLVTVRLQDPEPLRS